MNHAKPVAPRDCGCYRRLGMYGRLLCFSPETLLTMRQLPQRSVRSLSLVSTTLYAAVFPRLHRAITFRASNEWVLNILEVSPYLGDGPNCRAREILQHARELMVNAPYISLGFTAVCTIATSFHLPGRQEGSHWEVRTNQPLTGGF